MPETRGLGTSSDSFELLYPLHYSVEFRCSPPAASEKHSRIRESEPKVACQ